MKDDGEADRLPLAPLLPSRQLSTLLSLPRRLFNAPPLSIPKTRVMPSTILSFRVPPAPSTFVSSSSPSVLSAAVKGGKLVSTLCRLCGDLRILSVLLNVAIQVQHVAVDWPSGMRGRGVWHSGQTRTNGFESG